MRKGRISKSLKDKVLDLTTLSQYDKARIKLGTVSKMMARKGEDIKISNYIVGMEVKFSYFFNKNRDISKEKIGLWMTLGQQKTMYH